MATVSNTPSEDYPDLSPALETLDPALRESPLWSPDLAPVPAEGRTWNMGHIAAIWVGMAVCIPTYMLAASMLQAGLGWLEAMLLIGLANALITIPMVLNGHAGVRFGIPFPVLGRAVFGTRGVHVVTLARAVVACGWFGIQAWVGGVAVYALFQALTGGSFALGLVPGKFLGFAVFWALNVAVIWKGTESIKRLETWAAPVLLLMGFLLLLWGIQVGGSIGSVLAQARQWDHPTAWLEQTEQDVLLHQSPLRDFSGLPKAQEVQVTLLRGNDTVAGGNWKPFRADGAALGLSGSFGPAWSDPGALSGEAQPATPDDTATGSINDTRVMIRYRGQDGHTSSAVEVQFEPARKSIIGLWVFWLTGMVGFWATMSISISDITRYAHSQRDQVRGQFLGLPGTMVLFSFLGIFVTCAAVGRFSDVLVHADAPWDPASLLAHFRNPAVVVLAQGALLVATLSTNIAANVIAPANAFANLAPKRIGFREGGVLAALLGAALMPWWLVDRIVPALLLISACFGPVMGIMLADYFVLRKKALDLEGLYRPAGPYAYQNGFHHPAFWALLAGIIPTLVGYWVPSLAMLYQGSWFVGFAVAFAVYRFLALPPKAA